MGLVGAGFVGPQHIDAVRRLGFVDIVAIAGSSDESGRRKAEALGAQKGYGSYQALLDDPDVQVVHNATPNYLHYEVTSAALARGKHVVTDKPLAMTRRRPNGLSTRLSVPASWRRSRSTTAATRLCSRHVSRSRVATSARRISCTVTTCRIGCSKTPTTHGASILRRAAPRPRSATSARTGAIWLST